MPKCELHSDTGLKLKKTQTNTNSVLKPKMGLSKILHVTSAENSFWSINNLKNNTRINKFYFYSCIRRAVCKTIFPLWAQKRWSKWGEKGSGTIVTWHYNERGWRREVRQEEIKLRDSFLRNIECFFLKLINKAFALSWKTLLNFSSSFC